MPEHQPAAVHLDPSHTKDPSQSLYYQKIRQDLAQKHQVGNSPDGGASSHHAAKAPPPPPALVAPVEDTVEIKSELNWKKDGRGQSVIEANLSHVSALSTATRMERASFTPYTINLATKTGQLMDAYSKQFIQARSHNVLYAKLAQMKCGFLLTLMGILGVPWQDIERLQRETLKAAVEENLKSFAENEYNSEMLHIVSGGKELKKQVMVIEDVRQQLIKQMKNFGDDYAYTPTKIIEVQIDQCKKVMDTFSQERENLLYQLDFM